MKFCLVINAKKLIKKAAVLGIVISLSIIFYINYKEDVLSTVFNSNDEVIQFIEQIFQHRNNAVLSQDLELIKSMYDTSTQYGTWAYEYEQRKVKYIHNWEQKQGADFIEIIPKVVIKSIKKKENKYTINLLCSTEYKYIYEGLPNDVNSSRIGTYHIIDIINKEGKWIIGKEWYKDPFADSLNLDNIKVDSIKEYILSQSSRDLLGISERRKKAIQYAIEYCGAASEEQYGFMYNKKYRNYNSQGGDCANFASQVLFEGGKFRKTSGWNYDGRGATRSWVNAGGFKNYMVNSRRGSLIVYGKYDKVYKDSFKLLPGDFIAYEEKGDITHISIVTGADSKGYTLVSCHNTDRNKVPWDLGWSNKSIKFWLVRVNY